MAFYDMMAWLIDWHLCGVVFRASGVDGHGHVALGRRLSEHGWVIIEELAHSRGAVAL